jgi:hypothetical protein
MRLESVIGSPCLKNQSIDSWAKPGANRWARRAPRLAGAPGTAHIGDERQIASVGAVVASCPCVRESPLFVGLIRLRVDDDVRGIRQHEQTRCEEEASHEALSPIGSAHGFSLPTR